MVLKNNSNKIIGIGGTTILPGESGACPEGYEGNPVVRQYIKKGTLEEITGSGESGPAENARGGGDRAGAPGNRKGLKGQTRVAADEN